MIQSKLVRATIVGLMGLALPVMAAASHHRTHKPAAPGSKVVKADALSTVKSPLSKTGAKFAVKSAQKARTLSRTSRTSTHKLTASKTTGRKTLAARHNRARNLKSTSARASARTLSTRKPVAKTATKA